MEAILCKTVLMVGVVVTKLDPMTAMRKPGSQVKQSLIVVFVF